MTQVFRCDACGVFIQAGDLFCWSCGAQIGGGEPEAAGPAPTPPIRETDPDVALALRRAHLALQRGQIDEAERVVLEVLERDPLNVPSLSVLSEILRAKGDLVGAVAAAQRATDEAADGTAPPGSVAKAREQRAEIESRVVREVSRPGGRGSDGQLDLLVSPGPAWYTTPSCYLTLGVLGLISFALAAIAGVRGQAIGYIWLAVSLLGAGWTYTDAETRSLAGLFWAPIVLFTGPFGLGVYLLATHRGKR
jgi:hypothetical protein